MVTVRIDSTGEELDVIGTIAFVKQVNDIGDITKATSSYTWQLTFPKSPRNTTILKGLGIAGSTSTIPYDKIVCQILYNGQTVEPNGNLMITETVGKDYKGHVKAGLIDFLQDISNDKISDVIDLSSLNHLNTVQNIIDSFTADLPYKYIIAYYNGQKLSNHISGVTDLNPFALVPSISIKYLWDAIFAHYGWTYSGNFNFDDLWMTYPEAIAYSTDGSITALETNYNAQNISQTDAFPLPSVVNIDNDFVTQSSVNFVVQQTGNYRLKASVDGRTKYSYFGDYFYIPFLFQIKVSGMENTNFVSSRDGNEFEIDVTLTAGSLVTLYIERAPVSNSGAHFIRHEVYSGWMSIQALGVQEIDFSSALIKIKVKDFFKEMMVRNALTPFVDVENKAIRFRTLDERLTAPKIDWTKKYVKQGRSEKYVYNQYAQKNIIKHKYNDPNEDWANGVLLVNNQNQPEEKDLYNSFTYAPEQTLVEYNGTNFPSYFVQNFRMFDVEVSEVPGEDPDTLDLIADYKQLKDRFYVIKSEQRIDDIYILGELAEEFPLAVYSEVFGDIVFDDYSNMNQLIDNAKILTIDLALSLVDVVMLDFYKRYYFEQEAAYFILNSLTWKPNELARGEFVKINS